MPDVSILNILLYGEPIATLSRVAGDRTLFAFNESYIAAQNRPTLGLAFKDSFGELITDFKPVQKRLLPFFSNLLPEGRMRSYLAERAGVNPEREFYLLWALGQDLPGAITIEPADGQAWPPGTADVDDDASDKASRPNALRFSLAGVQLKFSAVNETTGGLTIPARGVGGSWIVKLPSRDYAGIPENEFSMMTLARLIGMDVPAIKLVNADAVENLPKGLGVLPGQALAIQRFDRLSNGATVHIEDFAQVFGVYPDEKYQRASYRNIANVVGAECSEADIAEFIRRLTFNTLIGNADMHLKNWSLIYPGRRKAALAPAYDFVSTIAYIPDANAALKFSRTKRFDGFTQDELTHLAAKAMLPEKPVLEAARQTVALFHQHWNAEKKNLPLSADVIRSIETHIKTLPIAKISA